MPNLNEMLQDRAKAIHECRALNDRVQKELRDFTAEERAQYDRMWADASALKDKITREEQLMAEERQLIVEAAADPENRQDPKAQDPASKQRKMEAAFDLALMGQPASYLRMNPLGFKSDSDLVARFMQGLSDVERRALQADAFAGGGSLVPPIQFVQDIIKAKDNLVFVRNLATKHSLPNAASIGAPSLDADPADPAWTAEIGSVSEDSTMATGRRDMIPHQLTKVLKVSRKLLRQVPSVAALVAGRLAYKSAVTEENVFLNGTGAGQPLGLFTASDNGIGTARDVSTGNETTEITFDGLKNAKYGLKAQYRNSPSNCWIFHRDGIKNLSLIKDSMGRYVWQEAVTLGEPDRLLAHPVYESEYAPNTFTTGLYVGLFGDLSFYWIVDSLAMELQVVDQLYAATSQMGYITRQELDGAPVLAEAFVRVKLA